MTDAMRTTRRAPSHQGTYDRPENVTSLLCPPAPWEIVADVRGDCLVSSIGANGVELFRFESLLDAWSPIIVEGEAAARRWSAQQWPKAAWQSATDDEGMRWIFKDGAEIRAKQAREAEALAQCEAAVRQLTEQLQLLTRLLVADLGASK